MTPKSLAKKYNNENFNNVAILIEANESQGFGYVYGRFVYIKTNDDGTEAIGFFDNYVCDGETIFNNLQFSCQYNTNDYDRDPREPYAFRLEYSDIREFNLQLTDGVALKLKYLKSLERKVIKHEEKFGRFADKFSRYVKTLSTIAGVTKFIKRTSFNTFNTEFEEIYDVQWHIDNKIAGN